MTRLWLNRFFSLAGLIISSLSCLWISRTILTFRATNQVAGFSYFWVFSIVVVISSGFLALTVFLFLPTTAQKTQDHLDHLIHRSVISPFLIAALFSVLFLIGAIYWLSASRSLFGPVYPVWMIPFFAWLTMISLVVLVHLTSIRAGYRLKDLGVLLLLLVILTSGIVVYLQFWDYGSPRKEDIFYIYLDGQRLLNSVNPYERVLSGDMQVNEKYSTYLPLFYYLSWATQASGLSTFGSWLSFWRVVFLVFNLLIASLLFYIPAKKDLIALAVFAALFWLFNRWTLHVGKTADIDFMAIFFMLLSLSCFRSHRLLSFMLYGISLGIKQVAIFLLPVYLIWVWVEADRHRWKNTFKAVIWIAIIPALISLPFLIWNWEGFIKSILFSATRQAMVAFGVDSIGSLLGMKGVTARLPLVVMLLLVYWITWHRDVRIYLPALLVMVVFVFFNPVMFTSYMVWIVPFIPLVVSDYLRQPGSEENRDS